MNNVKTMSESINKIFPEQEIRIRDDGLFNLNDMGRTAQIYDPNAKQDARPTTWLRTKTGQVLIKSLNDVSDKPVIEVVNGGVNTNRGVWGVFEVLIGYLSWVSPTFNIRVTMWYCEFITGNDRYSNIKLPENEIRNISTYIIHNPLSGLTKIGKSSDLETRLLDLSYANGCELEVLDIIHHDCELELHNRFKAYRKIGEWFKFPLAIRKQLSCLNISA